jgi:hypothetical protein
MQIRSKSKSKSTTKSTFNALNAERSTLIVSAHDKASEQEQSFVREVCAMLKLWSPQFAQDELANWGGWWRNRVREKPAKARRLVAELAGMIREHRVTDNPGAAAVDLWNRLP